MERDHVKDVFKVIKGIYPMFDVSSEKLDLWTRLLKDQNEAVIMRNTEKYVLSQKFPPTIADLREVRLEAHSSDFLKKVAKWEEEASGKPGS